jgi:hypothetical protein
MIVQHAERFMLTERRKFGSPIGRSLHAGALGFLLSLLHCGGLQAKLGETLPQLVKRFGNHYSMSGNSATGEQSYSFRLKQYAVTAVMTRNAAGELTAISEIYCSTAPLQANGDPPTPIVRGIMNVTAPGAKWLTSKPAYPELAAFITSDGEFEAVILPPNTEVDAHATFTLAVSKLDGTSGEQRPAAQTSSDSPTGPAISPDAGKSDIQAGAVPPPTSPIRIESSFVKILSGKSHSEIQALLGQPTEKFSQGYLYTAQVPGFWGIQDAYFIVLFAGDKARSFQLHTQTPLDGTFVKLILQNSPGAQFEPMYQARNLTGANWQDTQSGFAAFTTQMSEHEFLLTIDLTPWNERNFSPLHQATKPHPDGADR